MPRNKPGKVGENKSEVVRSLPLVCADEKMAVEFMERQRWGDCPCCPACSDTDVYAMKCRNDGREKHFRWRCRGCGKLYSVRTGTVMEETRIPLRHWCFAFWRACASKKGISAKQLQRETDLSYKSALFLLHRVRFAMADMEGVTLSGTVECDEAYIGGKPRYKGHNKRGRGTKKQPVFSMVERGGRVHTRVVPDVTANTLKGAIREVVDNQSRIMTDENSAYFGIGAEFAGGHQVVTHSAREYVRGDAHTNTAESVFALIKRGIYGVYHNVSKRHLHRYLAEVDFRYNHRKVEDGERTVSAIQSGIGRRLMYREPERLSA